MIKSMTGYGTATVQTEAGRSYTVEVKSVNHRYCDVHLKLPGKLSFLEHELKKVIKNRFQRGHFDVYVSMQEVAADGKKVTIDKDLAAYYLQVIRDFGEEFRLNAAHVDALAILRLPEVLKVEQTELDPEEAKQHIEGVLLAALDHLEQMRQHEGAMLAQDVAGYLDQMRAIATTIAQLAEATPVNYRAMLEERIKRLTENTLEIDPARLAQEVVMFAERIDIAEELARLNGHLAHVAHLIATEDAPGKKLDFMVQELNREINTIGSKSNNTEIAKLVIECKSILEKVREQIQNVE